MEEQIAELKKEHGTIYTLEVNSEKGELLTVYLKDLDRKIYKSCSALIQKDEMLGVEALLKNLWVGGDKVELITGDFKALRSAGTAILPILEVEAGELKKN